MMSVLNNSLILDRLNNYDDNIAKKLTITPILDENQFNPASIDLRLGTEFKVSIPTRSPMMGTVLEPLENFFQDTYREFGEEFILHPNQLILVNTFEYVRIPQDLVGLISTRSSLSRLGINVTSIVHPGYAGTLTLQLENNGVNAIKLTCGMRIIQLILFSSLENPSSYMSSSFAKYVGNTSPTISQINRDTDLEILNLLSQH